MRQVSLLSPIEIPRSELLQFFAQAGVKRGESAHRLAEHLLRAGEAQVWIEPESKEPHYPDPPVDALIEQKLGGPPRTHLLLHITSTPESEQLALDFACLLAERWPFVLDNLSGLARRIYGLADLQSLRQEKRGLWDEEKQASLPKDELADATFVPAWMEEQYRSQDKPLPEWMREERQRQALSTEGADNEDYLSQVRHLLNQGLKMEAVKLYRVSTGVSLKEARQAVDRLEE